MTGTGPGDTVHPTTRSLSLQPRNRQSPAELLLRRNLSSDIDGERLRLALAAWRLSLAGDWPQNERAGFSLLGVPAAWDLVGKLVAEGRVEMRIQTVSGRWTSTPRRRAAGAVSLVRFPS